MRQKKFAGFTLIELLIVVAIIAILAAIAIPNFLEAQTRSKVSRVKADFRTLATAIEIYHVENHGYPLNTNDGCHWADVVLNPLTTPIQYITNVRDRLDPFHPAMVITDYNNPHGSYLYFNLNKLPLHVYSWLRDAHGIDFENQYGRRAWTIVSTGPSRMQSHAEHLTHYPYCPEGKGVLYDPTNGTNSFGGILRAGGEPVAMP